MSHLKLVIGIPSGQEWKAEFGMCMTMLTAYLTQPFPGYTSPEFSVINRRGSVLPSQRYQLVKQAIEMEGTHILFLDTDMVFPRYTAHQLLSHKRRVVACNCATKMFPSTPTARQKGREHYGEPLYTPPPEHLTDPLPRVWRVGTGIMLLDLSVFENLPQPWFNVEWNEEVQDYQGEDWSLVKALDRAGHPVFVDQRLSWEIKHIGDVQYGHEMVALPGEQEGALKEAV